MITSINAIIASSEELSRASSNAHKIYMVKAFDEDNDEIEYLPDMNLRNERFANAIDVRNRLEPKIREYNEHPNRAYPVVRIEIYAHAKVGEANIEKELTTVVKNTDVIGDYKYTPLH